jgi:hypothetical protein
MSDNSTPESAAADQFVPGSSRPALTEAEVTDRVDALMAQMTVAEKAGQLTQYFYFNLPPSEEIEATLHADFSRQPAMVEAALSEGKVGSLLFVTDPAEVNRLQRLAVEGNRLGIPALFGFDVIHGLRTIMPVPIAMAASWDPTVIEQGQASPLASRVPSGSTGRSRRWSISRATPGGDGSSRALVRTPTSEAQSRSPRFAASRVRLLAPKTGSSPARSTSPDTAPP